MHKQLPENPSSHKIKRRVCIAGKDKDKPLNSVVNWKWGSALPGQLRRRGAALRSASLPRTSGRLLRGSNMLNQRHKKHFPRPPPAETALDPHQTCLACYPAKPGLLCPHHRRIPLTIVYFKARKLVLFYGTAQILENQVSLRPSPPPS